MASSSSASVGNPIVDTVYYLSQVVDVVRYP
jgi:hypothetical protein